MFINKSNASCKNILFNQGVMHQIHESMERLYKFARENKGITGQTELATALGEAPQTVNNWENPKRGISQRGANVAQKKIGCDANWILGKSANAYHIDRDQAATRMPATDTKGMWDWPFRRVSPAQFKMLRPDEKRHIEKDILIRVKNRGDPEKNSGPAHSNMANKAA